MGNQGEGAQPKESAGSLWAEREHDVAPAQGDEPAPPLDPPAPPEAKRVSISISVTPELLAGVIAALLLAVGSVGTWASVGPFSVSGLRGDGSLTLAAAVIALIPLLLGRAPGVTLAAGVVAAAVSIYDLARILPVVDENGLFSVSVGWGLVISALASIALLAVGLVGVRRTASRPVALAIGAIVTALLVMLTALGAAGVFADDEGSSDDATSEAVAPAPAPKVTDGMSTESCRRLGITSTGDVAGPCKSDSSGQVVWVAPSGRAATLESLSAAIEELTVSPTIDPDDGFSDPIQPDGVFVIAQLRVKNTGTTSIDLADGNFALQAAGGVYEPSGDSNVALLDGALAGGPSLGSGLTRRGIVVFDIPRSRVTELQRSGVLVVAPPAFVDEPDEAVQRTIRVAYLQTRGSVTQEEAALNGADSAEAESEDADAQSAAGVPGETRACDQNISAASGTTCEFAANTFKAYAAAVQSGSDASLSVSAYSPAAGKTISMYCDYVDPDVTCTGGTAAYVTFPKWAADVY